MFETDFGPIAGFLPTIAKQLGYSPTTYGNTLTAMSLITMILPLLSGIIVDKFRVKNKMFVTTVLGYGLMVFLFKFVPKLPLDAIVELGCGTNKSEIIMAVVNENNQQTTMIDKIINNLGQDNDELIKCEVSKLGRGGWNAKNVH